ncbi:uncharacterized protein [Diabrotica undecimpunctata]|uniref:uncharacterized protein n=1 Tax=Diabrotica undecimpunctata TaxID=50387 RepID=UPI003B6358BD
MIPQFIEQVQILMEIQQLKHAAADNWNEKSKYNWLCTKKCSLVILSLSHEYKLRQALNKVSLDEQVEILRKLIKYIDENPNTDVLKIPELTLDLINNMITFNIVNQTNFSRMSSFRNSLRRFSIGSIRISPHKTVEKTRNVTFKDTPIVYKISK